MQREHFLITSMLQKIGKMICRKSCHSHFYTLCIQENLSSMFLSHAFLGYQFIFIYLNVVTVASKSLEIKNVFASAFLTINAAFHTSVLLISSFFLFHCIRLQALEKSFILENGEASSVVKDIKLKVDSFKEKLEVCVKFSAD